MDFTACKAPGCNTQIKANFHYCYGCMVRLGFFDEKPGKARTCSVCEQITENSRRCPTCPNRT